MPGLVGVPVGGRATGILSQEDDALALAGGVQVDNQMYYYATGANATTCSYFQSVFAPSRQFNYQTVNHSFPYLFNKL